MESTPMTRLPLRCLAVGLLLTGLRVMTVDLVLQPLGWLLVTVGLLRWPGPPGRLLGATRALACLMIGGSISLSVWQTPPPGLATAVRVGLEHGWLLLTLLLWIMLPPRLEPARGQRCRDLLTILVLLGLTGAALPFLPGGLPMEVSVPLVILTVISLAVQLRLLVLLWRAPALPAPTLRVRVHHLLLLVAGCTIGLWGLLIPAPGVWSTTGRFWWRELQVWEEESSWQDPGAEPVARDEIEIQVLATHRRRPVLTWILDLDLAVDRDNRPVRAALRERFPQRDDRYHLAGEIVFEEQQPGLPPAVDLALALSSMRPPGRRVGWPTGSTDAPADWSARGSAPEIRLTLTWEHDSPDRLQLADWQGRELDATGDVIWQVTVRDRDGDAPPWTWTNEEP
jgi:hypothetical protein